MSSEFRHSCGCIYICIYLWVRCSANPCDAGCSCLLSLCLLFLCSVSDFEGFKLDFHGHVEPCRICRLCSDIFLVVYIYIYIWLQLTLACRLFLVVVLCLFGFFACFGFWVEMN